MSGKTTKQQQDEQQLQECTFKPDLSLTRNRKASPIRRPLLFLDVNLHSGNRRLIVREGDDYLQLVTSFGTKYGLNSKKQAKLLQVILSQIK